MAILKILICSTQSFFPDDRLGICADCQRRVYFRPHSPEDAQKACWRCAARRAHAEGHRTVTLEVAEGSKPEILAWLKAGAN